MKYTPKQYGIKAFWIMVNPIRHAYWFVTRPKTLGAKCLIEHDGSFLLVRLNYGHRLWTTPGGGVDRGEALDQAARREAFEEAGILPDHVTKLGEYTNTHQYKIDTVHVFYYRAKSKDFKIDGFEIAEAAWFKPDSLPPNRTPSTNQIMDLYRAKF